MTEVDIIKEILNHHTIIIHRHTNPDPDAIGSQVGLKELILHSFPDKEVYAVGDEEEGLRFLAEMDTIDDDQYKDALVIVCDTANLSRISDKRFEKGRTLIKIDHHPPVTEASELIKGDLEWVDTRYSSCSEMVASLTDWEFKDISFSHNHASARLLYAGIVGDTGRFQYKNTRPKTLRIAAELLQYNFEPQELFQHFYETAQKVKRLTGEVLLGFQTTEHGVAYFNMSEHLYAKYGVSRAAAANLVNTLSFIEGIHIWVFFVESGEESRVRIRSREVAIDQIARNFGGGGHPLASGATVTTDAEKKALIEELNAMLSNQPKVV